MKGIAMAHSGSCFCGAVKVEVTGSPEAMGYCHCSSCRSWSGGPVNAFSLWKPEAVRVTAGAEHIATFSKTAVSQRKYCAKCGGPPMTHNPPPVPSYLYTPRHPNIPLVPSVHCNYPHP